MPLIVQLVQRRAEFGFGKYQHPFHFVILELKMDGFLKSHQFWFGKCGKVPVKNSWNLFRFHPRKKRKRRWEIGALSFLLRKSALLVCGKEIGRTFEKIWLWITASVPTLSWERLSKFCSFVFCCLKTFKVSILGNLSMCRVIHERKGFFAADSVIHSYILVLHKVKILESGCVMWSDKAILCEISHTCVMLSTECQLLLLPANFFAWYLPPDFNVSDFAEPLKLLHHK